MEKVPNQLENNLFKNQRDISIPICEGIGLNTSVDTTSYPSSSHEDEKNEGEENNNNQEIENLLEQRQRANLNE